MCQTQAQHLGARTVTGWSHPPSDAATKAVAPGWQGASSREDYRRWQRDTHDRQELCSYETDKQQVKAVRRAMGVAAVAAGNAAPTATDSAPAAPRSTDPARLLAGMMRAKARGLTPADVTDTYSRAVYEAYEASLLEANALDLLDVLLVATRALSDAAESLTLGKHKARRRVGEVLPAIEGALRQ